MALKPLEQPRPTLRMVAKRVNLSVATVSLALRGAESIPLETRERVLAAARDVNYVPIQRTLVTTERQLHQMVFVMIDFGNNPVTSNPFFGEVLKGAERACSEFGLNMTFRTLPYPTTSAHELLHSLRGQRTDGLVLAGPCPAPVIEQIAETLECPVVLIDNTIPGIPFDSVMADDFGGGYQSARHLISLGHTHIAAIVGLFDRPSYMERYRGYCAACTEAGISPGPPEPCKWDWPDIRDMFREIAQRTPRPTAVFSVTDHYVAYGIDALRELGLDVPRDMSLVGFDQFSTARLAALPLTSVANHPRTLGRLGVQRVLARIEGDDDLAQGITVRTQLVIGQTTSAPNHGSLVLNLG